MKLQAYHPEWAFRAALQARAARWQRQQLLSPEQLAGIAVAYPLDYYRPVWPLRVALFLFAWFGLVMASGFTFLITGESLFAAGAVHCAACFGVLELLIRERKFYRAGADNALLYAGLGVAVALIFYVFSVYLWPVSLAHLALSNGYLAPPLLLTLALLLAATLRYADAVVSAAAFFNVLLLVALLGLQSALGQALLPFLAMAAAGGALVFQLLLRRRMAGTYLADYYATCLLVLKVLGLVVLYLGGNYLVVREGNAALHDLYTSVQVPFAAIFYAFTAGIPLLYIMLGLRRADRPTLLVGLLALAFSLYTLRHYRSLLPPEIAALLAGIVLTALAGILLRGLRPARFGLTSLPDDEPRHFNLENLIQAQTAHAPAAPAGGFAFGGGQSGGGGATGQF
ncbi:hypothetical protein [Hymenobacter terricola]|uniref:hypothetical protein n=1 Tax=Hymenobacter terricola TaxID=2819236 RepID=UPI001B30A0FD|nr:hypothetical protein [Hymenobacter terricola]